MQKFFALGSSIMFVCLWKVVDIYVIQNDFLSAVIPYRQFWWSDFLGAISEKDKKEYSDKLNDVAC